MNRGLVALLVSLLALAAFMVGRLSAPRPVSAAETQVAAKAEPPPGGRSLELARLRRLAVRVSSDDVVAGAVKDVEAALRNRLAAAGFVIVPVTEPHDAIVQARIEGFHFTAYDEHGAGSEVHVVGLHAVEVDGALRMIPHDLWQADAMRLARKERLEAEALSLSEELLQHLLGAIDRARAAR